MDVALYTLNEVAVLASVSRRTVERLVGQGRFDVVYVGTGVKKRAKRITRASFEAWLAGRTVVGTRNAECGTRNGQARKARSVRKRK